MTTTSTTTSERPGPQRMLRPEPGTDAASLLRGLQLPFEGARLLLRERRLWPLALMPVALSVIALATALTLLVAFAGDLYGWTAGSLPALEVARWYAWLWMGPATLLLWLLGVLLFALLAGLCLVGAYLVASLLAAPFHDALAAKVERLVTGTVRDDTDSGALGLLREALRSLREEGRRLVFFLALAAPLTLAGLLVPGAQIVTGPALVAITIFFLPLDYASYTLDRRRMPFAEKRRWLLARKPLMAGFGSSAFLIYAVPGLNLVAMPLLVVAGTLLVLRYAPAREAPPSGSSPS